MESGRWITETQGSPLRFARDDNSVAKCDSFEETGGVNEKRNLSHRRVPHVRLSVRGTKKLAKPILCFS
jgi:hypothetical protein